MIVRLLQFKENVHQYSVHLVNQITFSDVSIFGLYICWGISLEHKIAFVGILRNYNKMEIKNNKRDEKNNFWDIS